MDSHNTGHSHLPASETPLQIANRSAGDLEDLFSSFGLLNASIKALSINLWTLLELVTSLVVLGGLWFAIIASIVVARMNVAVTMVSIVALSLPALVALMDLSAASTYTMLQSALGIKTPYTVAVKAVWPRLWQFTVLSLYSSLMIVGGFILFIIPGIFMLKRYCLAPYYFFDRNLSAAEAMKKSTEESKILPNAVWGLLGVLIIIGIASSLPFIGLLGSVLQILYYCAAPLRYLQLKQAVSNRG